MAALRTSLIWHDEVMSDVVDERPRKITIGPHEDATFVTPPLGLPESFAVIRPGSRGRVLTLGGDMRGTICVGGVEHDVAQLVRESDGFHATAIGGVDWGVVELDASGHYKLFFAFVALDEVPSKPMFESDIEQRASFAFSMLLHAAVIFGTYQLYVHSESPIESERDFTVNYIATRIDRFETPAPKPAVAAPAPAPAEKTIATRMQSPPPWHEPDATRITQVKPVKGTDATKPPGPPSPLDARTERLFEQLRGGQNDIARLAQVGGGQQGGGPLGVPQGGGPRTHGTEDRPGGGPHGEFKSGPHGGLDVGGMRNATLCSGEGCGGAPVDVTPLGPPTHDDEPTLTPKEISDVIQAAKGRLTQCYQREVNRDPSLAGAIDVKFEIAATGSVTSAKVTRSTLRSDAVADCLTRQIGTLKFPARGRAIVNYPFVFASR